MPSILSVVLAGVASMVVGFLWYGPLFGKTLTKLMGWTKVPKMKTSPMHGYIIGFVGTLLMASVLNVLSVFMPPVSAAFLLWIGILVPVLAGAVLWEGRPVKLYALNAAHYLV